uniref:Eukaryotic translation initiation factor 3 subunit D n=1 Tax=Tetraselmis sp. GSL018 TaxID=582737 RepID=A0A061QVG9_9CHLO
MSTSTGNTAAVPKFQLPAVVDNPDGWGPGAVPLHLKEVPYAPFSKTDKLGKASDWTAQGFQRFRDRYAQGGANAVFNFFQAEDEDSFHLVDSRPVRSQQYKPRRFQQRPQQRRDRDAAGNEKDGTKQPVKAQPKKKNQWGYFQRNDTRQPVYSPSVEIRPEWAVHEQIPFASLGKLNLQVGEPEELMACGSVARYDKGYDRITPKMEKPLKPTDKVFRDVTASEDPVIRRLADAESPAAQVFTTDSVLSVLMTAPRSIYSWDIVASRSGDKLFLDKRDKSQIGMATVNETAPDPIPEDKDSMNSVQQLSKEATAISESFSQQVLDSQQEMHSLGEASPFPDAPEGEGPRPSKAYRYRRWKLNDGCHIVVRCELDAVLDVKGEAQVCTVRALNEFDPKVSMDWRKKLETQRGAVLATELKNNSNKMARWTTQALMAGLMKLGYVSRNTPRDNKKHTILGTQACKPKDLAQQMNLNMDNCWGIVRAVVDLCMKLGDGKYLILKDPNKQLLRIYEVPEDAFKTDYTEEPMVETEEALPPEAPAKGKEEED